MSSEKIYNLKDLISEIKLHEPYIMSLIGIMSPTNISKLTAPFNKDFTNYHKYIYIRLLFSSSKIEENYSIYIPLKYERIETISDDEYVQIFYLYDTNFEHKTEILVKVKNEELESLYSEGDLFIKEVWNLASSLGPAKPLTPEQLKEQVNRRLEEENRRRKPDDRFMPASVLTSSLPPSSSSTLLPSPSTNSSEVWYPSSALLGPAKPLTPEQLREQANRRREEENQRRNPDDRYSSASVLTSSLPPSSLSGGKKDYYKLYLKYKSKYLNFKSKY